MTDNFDLVKYMYEAKLQVGRRNDTLEDEANQTMEGVEAETSIEEVSIDALERMDGLVPQKSLQNLVKSAREVITDLKADGFEDDEIFDYIIERIKVLA